MVDRRQVVSGVLDDAVANDIGAWLLAASDADPAVPVRLEFEHCPGGDLTAGIAVYDVMAYVDPPIDVHVRGLAGGSAALLTVCASGRRTMAPGARLGEPCTISPAGPDTEFAVQLVGRLVREALGLPGDADLSHLDRWFDADDALAAGLIDAVGFPADAERRPG